MFYYTKTYLWFQPPSDRAVCLSVMIKCLSFFVCKCLFNQRGQPLNYSGLNFQTAGCMYWIFVAMYNSRIVHVIFAHAFKHSCSTKVCKKKALGLRSKVQHLQRDLHLKVQHLMMLCIRGVGLLFLFVILRSNSLL